DEPHESPRFSRSHRTPERISPQDRPRLPKLEPRSAEHTSQLPPHAAFATLPLRAIGRTRHPERPTQNEPPEPLELHLLDESRRPSFVTLANPCPIAAAPRTLSLHDALPI